MTRRKQRQFNRSKLLEDSRVPDNRRDWWREFIRQNQ